MKLDLNSFLFDLNLSIKGSTPAWGTALGQGEDYKFSFTESLTEKGEFFEAMLHCSIPELTIESFPSCFGRGNNNDGKYKLVICSHFKNIFVNNIRVENGQFLLLIVEQQTGTHKGRRLLKYNPRLSYNNISNQNCIELIKRILIEQNPLWDSDNGGWFVYEINLRNQNELHFSACTLDRKTFADSTDRRYAQTKAIHKMGANSKGDVGHYTSLSAAIDIIKGIDIKNSIIKLHATRSDCLNDPQEFRMAENKDIQDILERKGIDKSVYPYIISFCKELDNPVMWRLYQSKIQFVFDKTIITNKYKRGGKNSAVCSSVIYDDFRNVAAFSTYKEICESSENPLKIISSYKHIDYQIEKEWRLIYFPKSKDCLEANSRYGLVRMYVPVEIPLQALVGIIIYEFDNTTFEILKKQIEDLLIKFAGFDTNKIKDLVSQTKCAEYR